MISINSLKILLIEDSRSMALLFTEMILSLGKDIKLTHVATCANAITMLGNNKYDIIISDLGLPDSNGLDTIKNILPHSKETALVVLSGNSDEDTCFQAIKCGADDYMIKGEIDENIIFRSIIYSMERKKREVVQKENLERLKTMNELTFMQNSATTIQDIWKTLNNGLHDILDQQNGLIYQINTKNDAILIHQFGNLAKDLDIENVFFVKLKQLSIVNELITKNQNINNVNIESSFNEKNIHQILGIELPVDIIVQITKKYDAKEIITCRFSRDNSLYGIMVIFSNSLFTTEMTKILEAIIASTSLNIHRKIIENENKDFTLNLEKKVEQQTSQIVNINIRLENTLNKLTIVNKQLQTIIDTYPGALMVYDKDLNIVEASKKGIEFHKQKLKSKVIGKKCYELLHNHDKPCSDCLVQLSFETGKQYSRISNQDEIAKFGRIYEFLTSPMFDDKKQVIFAIEVAHDITDLIKAQEEVLIQEKKYSLLFENMTVAFVLFEAVFDQNNNPIDYIFKEANREFERNTKIKFQNIKNTSIGNTCLELLDYWRSILFEVTILGKNVSTQEYIKEIDKYLYLSFISPQKNQCAILFSDITPRIRMEQKLHKSEEKFRIISENISDVIFLIDMQNQFIYVTPSIFELSGYDAEHVTAGSLEDIIFADDYQDIASIIEKCCNENQNSFVKQFRVNHVNLKTQWVEGLFKPLANENEIIFGMQLSMRNIEMQLQAERNILTSLQKERELNTMKSEFVSIASHQIRTPLTTIKSSAEILQMVCKESDESLAKMKNTHFGKIHDEINRITELISDVLIISKSDAGKINPVFEPTNISAVCMELIVSNFDNLYDGRTIDFSEIGKPFEILIDPKLVSHSLMNILSNALKYSPGKANPQLKVTYFEDSIILSIIDFGIGISEDSLNRIFSEFFRAKNAMDFEGTGLGLAIAKKFIELNFGTIKVKSKIGDGSEFIIRFNKKTI